MGSIPHFLLLFKSHTSTAYVLCVPCSTALCWLLMTRLLSHWLASCRGLALAAKTFYTSNDTTGSLFFLEYHNIHTDTSYFSHISTTLAHMNTKSLFYSVSHSILEQSTGDTRVHTVVHAPS